MTESRLFAGFPRRHNGCRAARWPWARLVPALFMLSAALLIGLTGSQAAFAQPPAPGPSDVSVPSDDASESPSDAPLPPPAEQPVAEQPVAEQPVAEQPVAEQPVAEEPAPEPACSGCATCRPKPACCATCRPRPLERLRARLRCCLSRPKCEPRCCHVAPAVERVPVCAPADCAEAKKPVPVQFVSEPKPIEGPEQGDAHAFKPIFDGKTLKGWKVPNFGGQGEVEVKDGAIHIAMGADMSGIAYEGEVPETNYELAFEAQRVQGNDFFATTTFRVGKDPLTFVVGGWGGTVVGLSNVDFYDASDNMTTKFHDFKDETWYKVRIRVTDAKVECWIDDEKLVNQHREGHKFGIRWECEKCQPLGISTWCTGAAVKNIRLRKLSPKEIEASAKEAKQEKNEPSFG